MQIIEKISTWEVFSSICPFVKLLTEHHLEFLSLKGGCTDSSKYTLVKNTMLEITCHDLYNSDILCDIVILSLYQIDRLSRKLLTPPSLPRMTLAKL